MNDVQSSTASPWSYADGFSGVEIPGHRRILGSRDSSIRQCKLRCYCNFYGMVPNISLIAVLSDA